MSVTRAGRLQEFDSIWQVVDQNGDGVLDYGEFMRCFFGLMNEKRKLFVRKVLTLIVFQ